MLPMMLTVVGTTLRRTAVTDTVGTLSLAPAAGGVAAEPCVRRMSSTAPNATTAMRTPQMRWLPTRRDIPIELPSRNEMLMRGKTPKPPLENVPRITFPVEDEPRERAHLLIFVAQDPAHLLRHPPPGLSREYPTDGERLAALRSGLGAQRGRAGQYAESHEQINRELGDALQRELTPGDAPA